MAGTGEYNFGNAVKRYPSPRPMNTSQTTMKKCKLKAGNNGSLFLMTFGQGI